jgi:hypothetical protein
MIGYFFTAPVFGYLGYRATRKWKTGSRAAGCPGSIDLNNVPIRFMNFSNKPTQEIVAT